jgi:hypothetical protein
VDEVIKRPFEVGPIIQPIIHHGLSLAQDINEAIVLIDNDDLKDDSDDLIDGDSMPVKKRGRK